MVTNLRMIHRSSGVLNAAYILKEYICRCLFEPRPQKAAQIALLVFSVSFLFALRRNGTPGMQLRRDLASRCYAQSWVGFSRSKGVDHAQTVTPAPACNAGRHMQLCRRVVTRKKRRGVAGFAFNPRERQGYRRSAAG